MNLPLNDVDGCSSTVLSGYFKFGIATLIGWGGYGTTGTEIMIIYQIAEHQKLRVICEASNKE